MVSRQDSTREHIFVLRKCSTVMLCSNRSPHLLEVRERIRLNGRPLSKQQFAKYFWECRDLLEQTKVHN